MSDRPQSQTKDRFGHPIDPAVGYARGPILSSPLQESRRRQHAAALIQRRSREKGADSFYNFTGLHRDYAVQTDRTAYAEEWIGPAFFWEDFEKRARAHLGGNETHQVAVFNRASAGIVAAGLALSEANSVVVSVSPGGRPHPSISKGVALAQAELVEAASVLELEGFLSTKRVSLIMVTGVSSELHVMEEDLLMGFIACGALQGIPTFLDDAYGARLRPIVYGQRKSLQTGADIVITSCDKAGLGGPRAGLMAGRSDLVDRVLARGSELGLEARAPLSLGVYESLLRFRPDQLLKEVDLGKQIYNALAARYGEKRVTQTGLGATISEQEAWELVQSHCGHNQPLPVVPAEVTAGIGMYWLERYGIITVNALGQPGARVSLRFKPDPTEIERFGGISTLVDAIEDSFRWIAQRVESVPEMKHLILGEG